MEPKMKRSVQNSSDEKKARKRSVQARFDEFRTWSLQEIQKRFGTIPRRYIDQVEIQSVLSVLELTPSSESLMLDAGCGSGRFLTPLSEDMRIVGTDFSKGLLGKARKDAPEAPLCLADVEHLPFKDGIFDTVLSVRVLQHVASQKEAIKELSRVTKKGGTIIILAYNNLTLHALYKWIRQKLKNWKWHPDDYCSPWELKKMLGKAGVSVIKTRGTVMANPWFLNYFNLTHTLERVAPEPLGCYFEVFQKLEDKLGSKFPFRYVSDRTTIKGVKVGTPKLTRQT
jgi:ubiquinone/menaquinone biosynthesis C-methylase UbiE